MHEALSDGVVGLDEGRLDVVEEHAKGVTALHDWRDLQVGRERGKGRKGRGGGAGGDGKGGEGGGRKRCK